MRTRANRLIEQIRNAQEMGEEIIATSGLKSDDIIYCFATSKVLVINCQNYPAIWRFEDGYVELRKAIARLKSSIDTILLELGGNIYYEF
jgi:hypothetical protein